MKSFRSADRDEVVTMLERAIDQWRKVVLPEETGLSRPNVEGTIDALLQYFPLDGVDELVRMVIYGDTARALRDYGHQFHNGAPRKLLPDRVGDMPDILALREAFLDTVMEDGGATTDDGRWVTCIPRRRPRAVRVLFEMSR